MVSLLGKGGACWIAARWAGLDAAAAGGVASLMNARGLMELILLNVGLQAGLVGNVLFSVLVVMAIVTTLMAGPRSRARPSSGCEETGAAAAA
jgi:Kef-type K+ transport system membrane component KefB